MLIVPLEIMTRYLTKNILQYITKQKIKIKLYRNK